MVKGFNAFWYAITGKQIHFSFNSSQQRFVSPTYHCMQMVRTAIGLLQPMVSKAGPFVVDACAGSGADLLVMRLMMGIRKAHAVEHDDFEGVGTFNTLKKNNLGFDKAFFAENMEEEQAKYQLFNMKFEDYVRNILSKPSEEKTIDFLFIDPPFTLKSSKEMKKEEMLEAGLREMVDFLMTNIFNLLNEHSIKVKLACVKTRYPPETVRSYIEEIAKGVVFVAAEMCIPYKQNAVVEDVFHGFGTVGVFYYIFLAINPQMRVEVILNPEIWNRLVVNGETVQVNTSEFIKLGKPAYGETIGPHGKLMIEGTSPSEGWMVVKHPGGPKRKLDEQMEKERLLQEKKVKALPYRKVPEGET